MVRRKGREKLKGIAFIVLGIFLVVALFYGFGFLGTQIAGKVIFDLDANYVEGEPLEGVLSLSMREGELIPASSKIVFETSGERYEYDLADVVSGQVVDGSFYVEGASVAGEGEGYGVMGEREVYPSVSFVLDVFQKKESVSSGESSEVLEEEVVEENDSVENVSEKIVPEEEVTEEEIPVEEAPEEDAPESLPITGQVSLGIKIKIDGQVSVEDSFSYNLQEGESVEIKTGSVKAGSTKLSEDVLSLDVSGTTVSVTTDYSEVEQGFGEEFLGGEGVSLDIDLSGLNLVFGQGDLKVSLVYGEEEIVSLTASLQEDAVSPARDDSGEPESEEILEVLEEVEVNITEVVVVSTEPKNLSEVQIRALMNEFGNVVVETTKSELVGDRLVVRYELGKYWIEYSYDYEDEDIESLVKAERIAWLSDLANALVERVGFVEKVEEFGGDFDLASVGNSS